LICAAPPRFRTWRPFSAVRPQLDYDFNLFGALDVTIEELADSEIRQILTADTIIEQFDSHYARGRWSSPNLSSRTLFDAGVEPMYFRVLRDKIEPCIGELVSASNPVSLFRAEIEPLLRHALQRRLCSDPIAAS
jgi:hypothetical protein